MTYTVSGANFNKDVAAQEHLLIIKKIRRLKVKVWQAHLQE